MLTNKIFNASALAVVGVYGQGFDRVKNHRKLNLKELKERVANENSASQQ